MQVGTEKAKLVGQGEVRKADGTVVKFEFESNENITEEQLKEFFTKENIDGGNS
jgi:hypothetical protein